MLNNKGYGKAIHVQTTIEMERCIQVTKSRSFIKSESESEYIEMEYN